MLIPESNTIKQSQKQNFSYPQFPSSQSRSPRFDENSKSKYRFPAQSTSTSVALKPKNDLSSFKLGIPQTVPPPEHSLEPIESLRPKFPGGDLSRNGSEADSLIDLYQQSKLNGTVHAQALDMDDLEPWIHRDKLTIIEMQEYRDRGMEIPPELLERAEMDRELPPDSEFNGFHDQMAMTDGDEARYSDEDSADSDEGANDRFTPYDPRTAEEIAQNPYEDDLSRPVYQQHHLRASSSRIPLATSSPLPISAEQIERSTPLPRKRGASGNWDEDGLAYGKVRSRSHSMGSQILLDDSSNENAGPGSPLSQASASKSKATRGTAPSLGLGTKKAPTTPRIASGTKARATSSQKGSPAQRPGTRSGNEDRPRTAVNRPEGDPPWLATMYKPDPRLPPDQQILPTHAKRLMQEQWEKEGEAGSMFDRDFTPLAVNTDEQPRPQQLPEAEASGLEPGWPLKPPTKPSTPEPSKASSIEHAGYSTIPKIQSNPSIAAGSGSRPQGQEQAVPMEQMETEEAEGKKSKGCGCCSVM